MVKKIIGALMCLIPLFAVAVFSPDTFIAILIAILTCVCAIAYLGTIFYLFTE